MMRHWVFFLVAKMTQGNRRKQYESYLSKVNHHLNTLCQTKKYGS